MTFNFRIDKDAMKQQVDILYLEDANSSNSQFHTSSMSIDKQIERVKLAMARLNGFATDFIPVVFETPERYGYLIEFMVKGGALGRLSIAGLPLRTKKGTQYYSAKVEQARKQALAVAAHMFDAHANSTQHLPMSNPLMMYLLVDGEKTVMQMMVERHELPSTFLLTEATS